jgi:hypothetical protein
MADLVNKLLNVKNEKPCEQKIPLIASRLEA